MKVAYFGVLLSHPDELQESVEKGKKEKEKEEKGFEDEEKEAYEDEEGGDFKEDEDEEVEDDINIKSKRISISKFNTISKVM